MNAPFTPPAAPTAPSVTNLPAHEVLGVMLSVLLEKGRLGPAPSDVEAKEVADNLPASLKIERGMDIAGLSVPEVYVLTAHGNPAMSWNCNTGDVNLYKPLEMFVLVEQVIRRRMANAVVSRLEHPGGVLGEFHVLDGSSPFNIPADRPSWFVKNAISCRLTRGYLVCIEQRLKPSDAVETYFVTMHSSELAARFVEQYSAATEGLLEDAGDILRLFGMGAVVKKEDHGLRAEIEKLGMRELTHAELPWTALPAPQLDHTNQEYILATRVLANGCVQGLVRGTVKAGAVSQDGIALVGMSTFARPAVRVSQIARVLGLPTEHMVELRNDEYVSENEKLTLRRGLEHELDYPGHWVLRKANGQILANGLNRHDIWAEHELDQRSPVLAEDAFHLPSGWTIHRGATGNYSTIAAPFAKGFVTIDWGLREFMPGTSPHRDAVSKKQYTGRNWKATIVNDAVQWLRTTLAPNKR